MKILVTGSSGFLGSALSKILQNNDTKYVGIDIKQGIYTSHIGSVADQKFVSSVMKDIDYVIHTAVLHAPDIPNHTNEDFIDTNISGTLNLLEESVRHNVKGFVYTSTTGVYGDNIPKQADANSPWVTESTLELPDDIYGITKTSAENICKLFNQQNGIPIIILRPSRFFFNPDKLDPAREYPYEDLNIKANEYLHRRADVEDIAKAHVLAINKIHDIGFNKYILSATTPFSKTEFSELDSDPHTLVSRLFPKYLEIYDKHNWRMFPKIERVYDNAKARRDLGWKPKYDFQHVLDCLESSTDFRSPLSIEIANETIN